MRILELMGMSSTKYGGIEKFNKALKDKQRQDNFIFVYVETPRCQQYIEDMTSENSAIRSISNKSVISYCISVFCLILKFRPHIVHFHFGNEKLLLAPFIKLFFPWIRQVSTFHSEVKINSEKMRILYRIFFSVQTNIIAVSNGVRSQIAKIYDTKKLVTSYLGVKCDTSRSKEDARSILGLPNNRLIFTTIGFDIKIKGFDVLVDAIDVIVKELGRYLAPPHSEFLLVVVGLSENRESEFMDLVISKHLESYIKSMGIRNDIDDILSASDIYLQPSRTEAISLSIMEALCHGLPIIASNVGGVPEVVNNGLNGFLVEPEDTKALSKAIAYTINSPEMRTKMGVESLKLSSNFSLEAGVSNLLKYYRK